jgi:hypothetical protein
MPSSGEVMKDQYLHLSDQQLLSYIDAELPAHQAKHVRAHVDTCWKCRARRQELENAIAHFVRMHQREIETKPPALDGSRALLKARLAQLSMPEPAGRSSWLGILPRLILGLASVTFGLLLLLFYVRDGVHSNRLVASVAVVSAPNSRLTPGVALLASRHAVCESENAKNRTVPVALQRKVFEEYGLTGADPRAYEVDYLVTPALGGSDDIHNLWPHSYSATVWNAKVKDALEDRLRDMVCDGSLDLRSAQEEIAADWIAAYKKYFHTDKPLAAHTSSVFHE